MNRLEQLKKEYFVVYLCYAKCTLERTKARYFQRLMTLFEQIYQLHQQQQQA